MTYKATPAAYKAFHGLAGLKRRSALLDGQTLRHNVRGGYYTKNALNTIVWHENGQQRVVVMNDASGSDWAKIKKEK